jgi:hypothetical protein
MLMTAATETLRAVIIPAIDPPDPSNPGAKPGASALKASS